mmetsp:Transcript_121211/g.376817  ORF Transcript_121211/g.376817 Transcript_121211/m.376817 type:complete len:251 (-) Transcript_121211:134-886(-)
MMGTKHSRMPCLKPSTLPCGITKPTSARTIRGAAARKSMRLKTLEKKACRLGQQKRRRRNSRRNMQSMVVSHTAAGTPYHGEEAKTCVRLMQTVKSRKGGNILARRPAALLDSGLSRRYQIRARRLCRRPRERRYCARATSLSLLLRREFLRTGESKRSGAGSSGAGTSASGAGATAVRASVKTVDCERERWGLRSLPRMELTSLCGASPQLLGVSQASAEASSPACRSSPPTRLFALLSQCLAMGATSP